MRELERRRSQNQDLLPATEGTGPLLQRDYWAVFANRELRPSTVMDRVFANFCTLPPPALVEFEPGRRNADTAFEVGGELNITIHPAQQCRVRIIHRDANSITLATLEGHPEAGRITFGAYRDTSGAVIFHIRSRARSSSIGTRLGFLAVGDALQTNTWTDFINNTASLLQTEIDGPIRVATEVSEQAREDGEPLNAPTFLARGD